MSSDVAEVDGAAAEVAQRGQLELRERAIEKLVTAAAAEVDDVAGPVSRVLGQQVGRADLDGRPSADVTLAGDLVTASVSLSVRWPASVPDVADAVRHRVRERLSTLADLRVGHVDVVVTALPVDRRRRRRVE
ncbi:MAG: Asp23/Gls24 family envelope stress response protein [Frankiaceae bacterium]|nr:Asp23/Gls24 family envelope stress response protein [Frankiaceae bacterium]